MIYITHTVIYITAALLLCRKNIAHHAKEAQKYRQKVQEETDAYHHGAEEGRVRAGLRDAGAHRQYRKRTFEPGEKLLENDLSGQLGVSRTPYREAVLALAERQLVHIRPKKGTYVPYIDLKLVEEVRHLRSIVETELAVMACDLLTEEDLDVLRENIAIWKMYMERKQTDKILQYDKEFHRHFYEMCDRNYWYTLLESLSPHFDRTTVLSFRCRPVNGIVSDHEELVDAIAARDRGRAAETARRHMLRYTENIDTIRQAFPEYFA